MKKIAFFLDDVRRAAFYARVSGMQHRIEEQNLDISICFFRSRAAQNLDNEYNIGEYNIYDLPDLQDFDGIILDLYNVDQKENYWYGADVSRRIIKKARESGKPTIAIGNRLEGFYYVGIENIRAMTEIIDYVYSRKGCRNFWFLMGPKDNYENILRTKAIQDYLLEKEGKDYHEFFYFESYESITGNHGFRALRDAGMPLPDAIVCANDRIAIGAAEEAFKDGCRIPEDFLLTGFDNIEETESFIPSITTVDQCWTEPGKQCIDLFLKIWDGDEINKDTYLPTRIVPRKSTKDSAPGLDPAAVNSRVYHEISQEIFDSNLDSLEYGLLSCTNLREMGEVFQQTFSLLQCDSLFLVLDERIFEEAAEDAFLWDPHGKIDPQDETLPFCVEGYPDRMKVVFSCRDGKMSMENTVISGLYPYFEEEKGGHTWLFLPIHFRKYNVGFFAIREAIHMIRNQYMMRATSALTTAIENLYFKNRLRKINRMLSNASITDTMTGFYNRFGYRQIAVRLFEDKKKKKENLLIMYIDMDHLKYINDHYGHECGDSYILALTETMHEVWPARTIGIRMGGDEFLMISEKSPNLNPEEVLGRLRSKLPAPKESRNLPRVPSVSVGYVWTDMTADLTLEDYVKEADQLMYVQKSKRDG